MASTRSLSLNSGHHMPVVGFGTWQLGPGDTEKAVKTAIRAGYRHIDCAWLYDNEQYVGVAIDDVIKEGVVSRKDLFITSKVWNSMHSADNVQLSIQDSLTKLRLDYLDLCLIHMPIATKVDGENTPSRAVLSQDFDDVHFMETWKALEEAVDKGQVRSIGVSNFNHEQLQHVIDHCRIKPAVQQIEIHPHMTQMKLTAFCQDRGIAVTAFSCLGSPTRPWAFPEDPAPLEDPKIKEIANRHKKAPAQVILRWVEQRGISVIPKSATPSRIKENIDIFDFALTDNEMSVVNSCNRDFRMFGPQIVVDGKRQIVCQASPFYPYKLEY